nr:DUF805 domain-containing protein [Dyella sp. ASV24]
MNLTDFLFSFRGRVGRLQWWLFVILSALPGKILEGAWNRADEYSGVLVLVLTIASLAPLWMYLAVSAKRLHDCDFSAWWLLLMLVPYLGAFVLMIMNGFIAGTATPNRFGEPVGAREPQADRP